VAIGTKRRPVEAPGFSRGNVRQTKSGFSPGPFHKSHPTPIQKSHPTPTSERCRQPKAIHKYPKVHSGRLASPDPTPTIRLRAPHFPFNEQVADNALIELGEVSCPTWRLLVKVDRGILARFPVPTAKSRVNPIFDPQPQLFSKTLELRPLKDESKNNRIETTTSNPVPSSSATGSKNYLRKGLCSAEIGSS
jgi:hypothetical protein